MKTDYKNKEKSLISVIMGVYNPNVEYLMLAVKSIINQTVSDFEFIICDDGSTVNKYIFKYIENMDDRIVLIENPVNKGLAYTLNHCIKISNGKYIARQDADDISEADRLEKQVRFLENNADYAFVGSNIKYLSGEKIWGEYRLKKTPQKKDFVFRVPFMHASVVYRADIFDDMDNRYRVAKETRRCEDYDLFMHLYSKDMLCLLYTSPSPRDS